MKQQHLQPHKKASKQNGSIIVSILVVMFFLTTMLSALMVLSTSNLARARGRIMLLQAQYAAESGADSAIAQLNAGNESYGGTTSDTTLINVAQYKATYSVSVAAGADDKEKIVTATGKVYSPSTASSPSYTRNIRVTVQRTSTTSASSLMSRNIIDVDSSVKDISGTEIYLNGYLNIRSNSTNLYAEKITVAGKDTGALNCSIEGSGHLEKPSSLGVGEKVILRTAYNNCINPPGNTDNADFDVTVNDPSITQIQSMYIPWGQYMDNTYQNAPGGCNDWTGTSPHELPSTGNIKKTHYPDTGSGVTSSCGTSGNLDLGTDTYEIKDHIHVRANFCKGTPCSPTFNNTSGELKFVFIEGVIDFKRVMTSSGSSPIVFVTYGGDPGTHGACPYGDSIYINKDGSNGVNAPAAYFLAMSSVCLYQTKFDANPAIGGIGGKNLYISSNSGVPFSLFLDPAFPVDSIPIDLAWRAVRYERL